MRPRISSLLTIETSWLGPTPTKTNICLPTSEKHFILRTVVDSAIKTKLKEQFTIPYALCDSESHIICFLGKDKGGIEGRLYDILSLHAPSKPDDGLIEQYEQEYTKLIIQRMLLRKRAARRDCEMDDVKKYNEYLKSIDVQCRKWTLSEIVEYMNRYFGMVEDTKNYIIVKWITVQESKGKRSNDTPQYSFSVKLKAENRQSFIQIYENVALPEERAALPLLWCKHDKGRHYQGSCFGDNPGGRALNLWHGLQTIPNDTNSEDALPFFDHLRYIVCRGDDVLFNYLVRLFAHYVQKPLTKTDVCLVLKGRQGSGKSYITDGIFRLIFGEYYQNLKIEEFEHFNGCLATCLMLFLDETVPAWNKKLASKMKTIITAPTHSIEEKYMPRQTFVNRINVIMATNYDWCAPVEHDDRRYLVLELSDEKCGFQEHKKYWETLWAVPPAAVHKALLEIDISTFSPRDIPITRATREQKIMSFESPVKWWYEMLRDEVDDIFAYPYLAKTDFYNQYVAWMEIHEKGNKCYISTRFWRMMYPMLGNVYEEPRLRENHVQFRAFKLLSLEECKRAFCSYVHDPKFFAD